MENEDDVPAWNVSLSDDNKVGLEAKNFADLNALATSYRELEKFNNASLRIPGPDAGEEQWKEFRGKVSTKIPGMVQIPPDMNAEDVKLIMTKLGTPEESTAYEFDAVDGQSVPEGLAKIMHDANLTKSQARALANGMMKDAAGVTDENKNQFNMDMAVLNTEWGEAKGNKVATAINLVEKTGGPASLINDIKEGTANASTLRWLDGINKQFGGETSQFNSQPGGGSHQTPAEMQQSIADIQARPEYYGQDMVAQRLQKQVLELNMKLYK